MSELFDQANDPIVPPVQDTDPSGPTSFLARHKVAAGITSVIALGGGLIYNANNDGGNSQPDLAKHNKNTAYVGDGYDFEAGTSCGPNDNRAEGKKTFEDNKEHIQKYYNETRHELFSDRPELAKSRMDWINTNSSWQREILGSDWKENDPVATMQAWVERTSVKVAGEAVQTNNWGCHRNADGSWTIFDVPANSPFEAAWPEGTPMVVLDMEAAGGGVALYKDGSARISLADGHVVHIPAGEYILFKDTDGNYQIAVSVFTCDNPQTPEKPGKPTTTTVTSSPPGRPRITVTTTTTPNTTTTYPDKQPVPLPDRDGESGEPGAGGEPEEGMDPQNDSDQTGYGPGDTEPTPSTTTTTMPPAQDGTTPTTSPENPGSSESPPTTAAGEPVDNDEQPPQPTD